MILFRLNLFQEVLNELNIDYLEYETALGISDDNDFQLYLRRPTNSCFVNNYFDIGLLAWEANMDIQPVFNYYKAITYMCSYMLKQEDECSQAMKQAVKESAESQLDSYQQMNTVAHAYATKREGSIREAVYHIMPELWLRKIFPGALYANSNLPEKRIKMILSEKEIAELPDESLDGFFLCFFMHFCPGTITTHAESINSDLQRGLDRRLRHIQH